MEELKGKKLLILGGSQVNSKFVSCAKKLGIHTIVADIVLDAPAKKIADAALDCSVFDYDRIKEYCIEHAVDGVANFSNTFSQMTCKRLTDELGLPGYGKNASIVELTEKTAFKAACQRNGLDVIDSFTEEDVLQDKTEYPLFIKPDDNSGSKGISFCHSKEEAIAAIRLAKENSSNGKVVIEKSMEGKPDVAASYYCVNGEAYLTRTADRILGLASENLDRSAVAAVVPSKYTQLILALDQNVKKLLRDLRIENGPVFFQGFVDGETIRFYDPGARFPGGGEYEGMLKRLTGLDYVEMSVRYAVTGETPADPERLKDVYRINGKKYLQLEFPLMPGTIGEASGVREIESLPYVTSVIQYHKVGDKIRFVNDISRRGIKVSLLVENKPDAVLEAYEEIRRLVCWRDTRGENMLATLADPALLI